MFYAYAINCIIICAIVLSIGMVQNSVKSCAVVCKE